MVKNVYISKVIKLIFVLTTFPWDYYSYVCHYNSYSVTLYDSTTLKKEKKSMIWTYRLFLSPPHYFSILIACMSLYGVCARGNFPNNTKISPKIQIDIFHTYQECIIRPLHICAQFWYHCFFFILGVTLSYVITNEDYHVLSF